LCGGGRWPLGNAQPSITVLVASGVGCLAITSTLVRFLKSAFDLEIHISPESLKSAVGTGDSSHDITSLMSISLELA